MANEESTQSPKKEDKEEKSSAYKPTGKWAGEAFDFLRLFYRVGDQVTGLIILQIGWAVFLVLIASLGPENSVRIIGIPWIENTQLIIRDVRLTSILFVGSIFIAFIWAVTSGLYLYILIPIQRLIRILLVLLLQPLFILIVIPIIPVYFISQAVLSYKIRKELKTYSPEKIKKLEDYIAEKGTEGKKALREQMSKRLRFNPLAPMDKIGALYDKAVITLMSKGFIGLAPLNSYTFQEEQEALKAPTQIFAGAIGQLQLNLRKVVSLKRIEFRVLPLIVKVHTNNRARFVRKWLGWDAIMWGSYLETDPSSLIWLNFEQALNQKDENSERERASDNVLCNDLFYTFSGFQIDPMVVIEQEDPLDAYIALLLTLIVTIQARQSRRIFWGQRWRDEIFRYGSKDELVIITHIVRDTLFKLKAPISKDSAYLTAKEALLNLAGHWLTTQVDDWQFVIPNDYPRPSYIVLRDVALRCVTLDSDNPHHHYRLAAIECLLGNESGAQKAIQQALEKDAELKWLEESSLYSIASISMIELKGEPDKDDRVLAKLFVYLARAMEVGGDLTKEALRKEFLRTETYKWQKLMGEQPTNCQKLIYSLLNIDEAVET